MVGPHAGRQVLTLKLAAAAATLSPPKRADCRSLCLVVPGTGRPTTPGTSPLTKLGEGHVLLPGARNACSFFTLRKHVMQTIKMKHLGIGLLATLIIGSNAALAGEITGNGKWIAGSPDAPLNGKSACAYSGQEDLQYTDPPQSDAHAQSWGQIPKLVRDFFTTIGFNPGVACNPTLAQ